MSIISTFEVLFLFESLRNVDLLEQGLYSIRARLCTDKDNYGIPLATFNTATPARKIRNPRHQIFAPYITTKTNAYCTRSFWVQFVEETIELNEAVVFRIDVNTSDIDSASVTLELDLLFSENESITSPQLLQSVSQQKYKLCVGKGLHQFYPITFDEWHFSIIRFAAHSCLVDCTYKPQSRKSFLRLPVFSPSATRHANVDVTDTTIFGAPWRKIIQSAFQRLVKKYQQISTRLSAKQQIACAPLLQSPVLIDCKEKGVIHETAKDYSAKIPDLPAISLPARPPRGPMPSDLVAVEVINELNYMSEQLFELWQRYLLIFCMVGKEDTFRMAQKYDKKSIEIWKEPFFREKAKISTMDELLSIRSNPQKQKAQTLRGTTYHKKIKPSKIVPICTKPELSVQPVVIEQVISFLTDDDANADRNEFLYDDGVSKILGCSSTKYVKDYEGVHLFVLVHGLLGNAWDMRMFRNQIAMFLPESEFLICTSIEQLTLSDIEEMGNAVANEISTYITKNELKIGRLSFVGHSLGGLVLRSALRNEVLQPYLCKLYTFLSLSVPHIGTIFPNSQLIPSAMWVWQKWTNSTSLKQLRLMDNSDPYKTFLYKLSVEKGLEYFKNILLVSSDQDSYVPSHSARIELRKEILTDTSRHGAAFLSMAQNLWYPVVQKYMETNSATGSSNNNNDETFCLFSGLASKEGSSSSSGSKINCNDPIIAVRYDVTFASHRGVDGVIGRAAHIRVLDNAKLMQMFISNNRQYFT